MTEPCDGCWRLADVVFDPADGTLWRDGRRVDLTPKTLAILRVLVEAAPRVVTKEQLLDSVWPEAVVAEAALTQRVRELRHLLGDDARNPRFVETVARRGFRLVAAVERLAATPAPAQVPLAAVEPPPGAVALARPAPGTRPRGWRTGALLAVTATIVGLAAWQSVRPPRPPAAPPMPVASPFVPRRAVAVLELATEPGDADAAWVATAMAEMLTDELRAGGGLRTVSRNALAEAMRELGLSGSAPSADEMRRLHALLGADLLVAGRCRLLHEGSAPEVGLDLEVHDVGAGVVLAGVHELAPLDALAALAARAGARLRQIGGAPALPPAEATRVHGSHPADLEATRRYAEGLSRLRLFEFAPAVASFEAALAREPESVVIRTALAGALTWTGQEDRAREELAQALEGTRGMPRELQLAIEADYREMTGEWQRALEINRSLYVLHPDELEHGLSLVTLLASHGREEEALEVLAGLRRLPGPLGLDPRIDLADAWMHESDLTGKLAAASRAAERARELGARLLLAAARIQQGRAYRGLGKPEEALAAFEEAWRLREAAGETAGVGKALRHVAAVERDRGQLEQANAHLRSAAEIASRGGDIRQLVGVLRDLAAVALDRGSTDEAARHLAAAAAAAAGQTIPEETSLLAVESARLRLLAGSPTSAVAVARTAVAACADERLTFAQARARALLARALLAAGELESAAAEAAVATRLGAATDDRATRLEVAVAATLVAAARADCATAAAALERALAEAPHAPIGLRLEALAAGGACARQLGDEAAALATWRDVAAEAERLGFRPVGAAARTAMAGREH